MYVTEKFRAGEVQRLWENFYGNETKWFNFKGSDTSSKPLTPKILNYVNSSY